MKCRLGVALALLLLSTTALAQTPVQCAFSAGDVCITRSGVIRFGGTPIAPTPTGIANSTVAGIGDIKIGGITISVTRSGISIAVPDHVASAIAIASGGSGYNISDLVTDAFGGSYLVTARNSSGVVTDLLAMNPPVVNGAVPSNPIATSGGAGTGLTVDATWATGGDVAVSTAGNVSVTAVGTTTVTSTSDVSVGSTSGDIFVASDAGSVSVTSLGNVTVTTGNAAVINSTGNVSITSGGTISASAGSNSVTVSPSAVTAVGASNSVTIDSAGVNLVTGANNLSISGSAVQITGDASTTVQAAVGANASVTVNNTSVKAAFSTNNVTVDATGTSVTGAVFYPTFIDGSPFTYTLCVDGTTGQLIKATSTGAFC